MIKKIVAGLATATLAGGLGVWAPWAAQSSSRVRMT
jgi:hypothetical protein